MRNSAISRASRSLFSGARSSFVRYLKRAISVPRWERATPVAHPNARHPERSEGSPANGDSIPGRSHAALGMTEWPYAMLRSMPRLRLAGRAHQRGAAIDDQRVAGDVARVVGQQEAHGMADV